MKEARMATSKVTQRKSKKRLSYGDLSLDEVRRKFKLTLARASLFERLAVLAPSAWLREVLDESVEMSVVSEKARSEFIVAPILLYIKELHPGQISVYSGVTFDVDPEMGLRGTCDFILSRSPSLPTVQAPVLMLVEAKKNDIEEGLGQCVAEMLAAQIFNRAEGNDLPAIYGCVTTGEAWQFLRLRDSQLEIDGQRYFLVKLDDVLGALNTIVKEALSWQKT